MLKLIYLIFLFFGDANSFELDQQEQIHPLQVLCVKSILKALFEGKSFKFNLATENAINYIAEKFIELYGDEAWMRVKEEKIIKCEVDSETPILAVCISKNGKKFVTGHSNGQVKLWYLNLLPKINDNDSDKFQLLLEYEKSLFDIGCHILRVEADKNMNRIAGYSHEKRKLHEDDIEKDGILIRIWNIGDDKIIGYFCNNAYVISLSLEGDCVAMGSNKGQVSIGCLNEVEFVTFHEILPAVQSSDEYKIACVKIHLDIDKKLIIAIFMLGAKIFKFHKSDSNIFTIEGSQEFDFKDNNFPGNSLVSEILISPDSRYLIMSFECSWKIFHIFKDQEFFLVNLSEKRSYELFSFINEYFLLDDENKLIIVNPKLISSDNKICVFFCLISDESYELPRRFIKNLCLKTFKHIKALEIEEDSEENILPLLDFSNNHRTILQVYSKNDGSKIKVVMLPIGDVSDLYQFESNY